MPDSKEPLLLSFAFEYFGSKAWPPEVMLRALVPVLPGFLIPRAAELSHRIPQEERGLVQIGLRLRLGDVDQTRRLVHAFRAIRFSSGQTTGEKALAFVTLASCLPEPLSGPLLDEARAFVGHLDDDVVRTQAFQALAVHLPEAQKAEALEQIHKLTNTPGYTTRLLSLSNEGYQQLVSLPGFGRFEQDLHHVLDALQPEAQAALFNVALDAIDARLGRPSEREEATASIVKGVAVPRERVVNTGFASTSLPGEGFYASAPLMPGLDYLYWLEIGRQLPTSIERTPTALPLELLPTEARLQVVLFGFNGEIEIEPGADVGEIQLTRDGLARVLSQPIADPSRAPISDRLDRRLFFPVRTPNTEGRFRLRCSIYCRQVLVQSRLVSAQVAAVPELNNGATESVVDYTLTQSLNLANVAAFRPHRFSLMVNGSDDHTHSFRFFGVNESAPVIRSIDLQADKVNGWIKEGRARLRQTSWGTDGEWKQGMAFRYEGATTEMKKLSPRDRDRTLGQLASDLARLAVSGYRMFRDLAIPLGVSRDAELEQLVRGPGAVQVAIRMSDRLVLPAALIYDYHWDTNAFPIDKTKYAICPAFLESMMGPAPLEECTCFAGACPLKIKGDALLADPDGRLAGLGPSICPSGFWGFRHALGLPLTLSTGEAGNAGNAPADVPGFILFHDKLQVATGISTDPNFRQFATHEQVLRQLSGIDWGVASKTRADVLKMLKAVHAQVIYLYCHGGVLGERTPFISVGYKESPITPDNIQGVRWNTPNPLLFINGCHTTALDPEKALDFVSTFMDANAAGVVGTEITISESLACAFAEEFLSRFLAADGGAGEMRTIGESVRGARLALLKRGNPLGLVYIPFAVESLRLRRDV